MEFYSICDSFSTGNPKKFYYGGTAVQGLLPTGPGGFTIGPSIRKKQERM
jgi:hypothetical protein